MMPAEYEDVLTTFGIVKTFSIILAVARSYYDIMLAKRGNSIKYSEHALYSDSAARDLPF